MPACRLMVPLLFASSLLGASPAEIRALIVNRVDEAHKAVGIVVGTIGPSGRE